jgi:hypothetical protein
LAAFEEVQAMSLKDRDRMAAELASLG